VSASLRLNGAKVRRVRTRLTLTLEEFASLAGLGISTIQRAERGDAIQRAGAESIADVLELQLEELLAPITPDADEPLVGRDAEWSLIADALEQARSGKPATILLSGVAGIGKTCLLDKLTERVRTQRGLVLHGEGAQFRANRFAFEAFIDALRPHANRL